MSRRKILRSIIDGGVGFFTGSTPKQLSAGSKALGVGAIGAGVGFGASMVNEGVNSYRGYAERGGQPAPHQRMLMEQQRADEMSLREMELNMTAKRAAEITGRLVERNPHLVNEVLAGRKLPQGAVVIGGTPDVDALANLSYDMAQPNFQGIQ